MAKSGAMAAAVWGSSGVQGTLMNPAALRWLSVKRYQTPMLKTLYMVLESSYSSSIDIIGDASPVDLHLNGLAV
jgi:hypothetical protein